MLRPTLLASLVLLVACSTTARLYPVEGPMAVSGDVLVTTVNGIMGNNGSLSMQMPDGTVWGGEWSSAAGAGITTGAVSATSVASSGSLISTYGSIVGISTGTGQIVGKAYCSAEMADNSKSSS